MKSGSVRSCVSDEWLCREEEGFVSTGYLIELVFAGFFILTNPIVGSKQSCCYREIINHSETLSSAQRLDGVSASQHNLAV